MHKENSWLSYHPFVFNPQLLMIMEGMRFCFEVWDRLCKAEDLSLKFIANPEQLSSFCLASETAVSYLAGSATSTGWVSGNAMTKV